MGPLSHSDILHDISAASEAVVTSQQPLEQRIARLWRDSRTNNNRDSTSPLVVFELLSYEQFMVKTKPTFKTLLKQHFLKSWCALKCQ